MENHRHSLNAVIFETPPSIRSLIGREKSESLSTYARSALFKSAELSGVTLGPLEKGDRGEPIPANGSYWTLSHTTDLVAGVVAPFAVGIDIEKIAPVSQALRAKLAGPREWALANDNGDNTFCRIWTAKEAVLKAVGAGLGGLSRCSVVEIADEHHTRLEYEAKNWIVSHYFDITGYIASITVPADAVNWLYAPTPH
jgi:4'-phosphopantetheinyl transferase